ncbi:MAG TPA: hypothetical protein VE175_05105 [Woeseiaceae bacterium]|nr:hypothetical protein [Woeseiaceae bacterium]
MRFYRLVAIVSLIVPTLAASASPGRTLMPVDPALFQELQWRLVGPFRGGRVLAVSGVPGEPNHFYFGAVNGGVWETFDAGRSWRPIFDDQPVGSIGAVGVAPSDPRVIYVGTGEADMRSDIAQGKGVFKSVDGGATWHFVGLADTQQIGRIRIDPRDSDVVFVAALGHPYGPNRQRGVFKSTDGGRHWRKVLGPDENTGAIDIVFEPGEPEVLYAALWQTRRPPWNIYPPSNGPGSGLYKSTDGGETWNEIEGNGFPATPGRIGLAVTPSRPARIYALVDTEQGGVYRSDDRGMHWRRTSDDPRLWSRGWYFAGITVEPRDADVVYVCNTAFYRSTDGGDTFEALEGDPTGDDFHELWINPEDPAQRILGTDQGTVISVNGGRSWSSWYNQPTAQLYHVSTDDRFPYWVYGPQQDSGAVGLPSRTSTGDGITLEQFKEVTAGGEAQNVVPDPLDPEVIYGGTVEKLDQRTEQTRSIDPTVAHPAQWRRTWTLPLAFSRKDPQVLYFGRQRVFRTADSGEHWEIISPDLTRANPAIPPNLDPATAGHDLGLGARRGVVYALAPSRVAERDLWAGTDDGLVWHTRNEGETWDDVTPAALTPWSKVGIIETSHFDRDTAYVAVDRHRLDDREPYIYRTHDGGKHWALIVDGIPGGHFVNAVREDPVRKGMLYAATEEGVEVSLDDGDHWQPLQLNLPVTSVRDLVVKENDLVIATHGRGIWILDDVTSLRQLTAEVTAASAWLFQPATAYRIRPAGFTGTPMPKDEPTASNPPAGAWIDYALRRVPSQPVTLEIRDATREVVQRWSSADEPTRPDFSQARMAPKWYVAPVRLRTTPGMHRFVWPLRYAQPAALRPKQDSTDDPSRLGVWAPPGEYTVELTVDGQTLRHSLTLAPDPRVQLDADAYQEQFELARKVEAIQARIAAAQDGAVKVQKQLDSHLAEADGDVRAALEAFQDRLSLISGAQSMPNHFNSWSVPPKRIESLRWLASALGNLMTVVDGADAAPSPEARDGYAALAPVADSTVAAWNDLLATDLVALNEKLTAAALQPIRPGGTAASRTP